MLERNRPGRVGRNHSRNPQPSLVGKLEGATPILRIWAGTWLFLPWERRALNASPIWGISGRWPSLHPVAVVEWCLMRHDPRLVEDLGQESLGVGAGVSPLGASLLSYLSSSRRSVKIRQGLLASSPKLGHFGDRLQKIQTSVG